MTINSICFCFIRIMRKKNGKIKHFRYLTPVNQRNISPRFPQSDKNLGELLVALRKGTGKELTDIMGNTHKMGCQADSFTFSYLSV